MGAGEDLAAVAGEGRGNPFEQSLPGTSRIALAGGATPSAPAPRVPQYAQLLRQNNGMGIIQSQNSLPRGYN